MNDSHEPIEDCLTEQGHTKQEIERILARLDEYDQRTIRDSVFDSIAGGSFEFEDAQAEEKHDTAC